MGLGAYEMSGTLFPFPKEEWNNTPSNKKYANEKLYNLNALFHLGSKKTKPNKETTNDNLKKHGRITLFHAMFLKIGLLLLFLLFSDHFVSTIRTYISAGL